MVVWFVHDRLPLKRSELASETIDCGLARTVGAIPQASCSDISLTEADLVSYRCVGRTDVSAPRMLFGTLERTLTIL